MIGMALVLFPSAAGMAMCDHEKIGVFGSGGSLCKQHSIFQISDSNTHRVS